MTRIMFVRLKMSQSITWLVNHSCITLTLKKAVAFIGRQGRRGVLNSHLDETCYRHTHRSEDIIACILNDIREV